MDRIEFLRELEREPIVNSHSHHLRDRDQHALTLDALLRNSYVSWCGAALPPAHSRADIEAWLRAVRTRSYVSPRIDEEKLNSGKKIPLVLVDRTRFMTDKNVGFVYTNNYLGGSLAAERFLKRGFDRFICVAGVGKEGRNAIQRVEGFKDTLTRNGVVPDQISIYNCEFTFEFQSVYDRVQKLLEAGEISRNSALFVCSDLGAWGAIEALKKTGMRIPGDIGVIGYDNIVWSEWFVPKLTTVENNQSLMGANAAEMLVNAIESGEKLDGKYALLDVRLIERNSV